MKKERKNRNCWNKERCTEEALKYEKRSEFKRNSAGAYNSCENHGWVDELCFHMKSFGNRFNRLVYVYEFNDKAFMLD